ncbi:MAG TPA: type II secretion system protein [Blastocatellia bacterium]|nr:type II secretion system protein [Blastocatellia bacterium]
MMYTFNQTEIQALKPESRTQDVAGNSRGITLVEVLLAISIIAVLIALLLPVIQSKREDYAADKAAQNLSALLAASREYFMRMASSPMNISDLVGFCAANPGSCSLDQRLASGETGYVYMVVGGSLADGTYQIAAEPEYPGITGSYTLTIGPDGIVNRVPTPGSDEARQRAFDNILASGARTIVNLLALNQGATSQIRDYAESPDRVPEVFNVIDVDGDGVVSVVEINWGDGAVGFTDTTFDDEALRRPLESFLAFVARELRLDSLSDADGGAVAVSAGDITGDGEDLLVSYQGLRDLTGILVREGTGGTVLGSLRSKLNAAETAEANGNENKKSKKLQEYRMLVAAQIGKSLTRTNANTLIKLSACL